MSVVTQKKKITTTQNGMAHIIFTYMGLGSRPSSISLQGLGQWVP